MSDGPAFSSSVDQLAACIDSLEACTGELTKVVAALPAAMEQVIKASAMDQKTQLTDAVSYQKTQLTDALSGQKIMLNDALSVLITSHAGE